LANYVLLEPDDGRILGLKWRRILLFDASFDPAHFSLRLRHGVSGLQASHHAPVVPGADRVSGVAGRGDRKPDFRLLGTSKARGHYADDAGRHAGHA